MSSFVENLVRRVKYGRPVVLVSGLPRSGTSMAMKMLDAGGLKLVQDGERSADIDNPKGYFEDERVKDLAEMQDKSWLKGAQGKVIKVVSSLLQYLPSDFSYKVVFLRREIDEVLASQAKMLERRGEVNEASDEDMKKMYEQHLEKVLFQLRFRKNFETLYVRYREVLNDPKTQAEKINEFLGGSLDVDAMAAVVDPSLYRNRSS